MGRNYIPVRYARAIYQFLNDLAFKNNVSIKEVETVLLRAKMKELGFTCDHKNIKYSAKTGDPFCPDCWTRMIELKPAVPNARGEVEVPAIVAIKETFLDTMKADKKQEEDQQEENQQEEVVQDEEEVLTN